jgi:DNA polymerase-3 subunit delta
VNLRPDQLAAHLCKPLAALYVVHGDEPLLVAEAGDAIRVAARSQGYSDREVLVAHAHFKWDELFLAAGNLSLFGGNKLVDLRIPSGKPGRPGADALGRYCGRLPQGVVTLITLPQLDWQARKGAWFATLQQAGVMIETNAPAIERLPDWIAARLARQGQNAPRDALELIATYVEGNLLAAHQEIQKLGLLHPPGALTREQVEDAVLNVARYDAQKLRAALASGDGARCARLLDGLKAEGVAAHLVLWAMASEIRSLGGVRSSWGGRSPSAPALTAGRLRAALLHAARIDRMIKGLAAGDVWDEFLQLALRIAGRRLAG